MNKLTKLLFIIVFFWTTHSFAYTSSCTGFFISSNGYIATAAHCYDKDQIDVLVPGRTQPYPATVVIRDIKKDVMILKIDMINTPYFQLSVSYVQGTKLTGYGFPDPDLLSYGLKANKGYIVGLTKDWIIVTMLIGPGISGGPVINCEHKVVGLVSAGYQAFDTEFSTRGLLSRSDSLLVYTVSLPMEYIYRDETDNKKIVLILGGV